MYIHVQASIPGVTSTPGYEVVNNWYAETTDVHGQTYVGATDFCTSLQEFYNGMPRMAVGFAGTEGLFKVYDLSLVRPNLPFLQIGFVTPGAPPGTWFDLPHEVSLCLSFHSQMLSGTNPQSRRGRVYLGPWGYGAFQNFLRPPGAFVASIAAAGNQLLQRSNGTLNWSWATFSPTLAGGWFVKPPTGSPPDLAHAVRPVIGGYVDNEWDTQRRRGFDADARSPFGVQTGQARADVTLARPPDDSGPATE